MITNIKFNPLIANFDLVGSIPQLDADPSSPNAEDVWVLRTITGGVGGGEIKGFTGMGMPILTVGAGGSQTYQLSYYTKEGTIERASLS